MTTGDAETGVPPGPRRTARDGHQVVFTKPGIVALLDMDDPDPTQQDGPSVRNRLSMISPGTELAHLDAKTGAVKPVSFPVTPRAYCVGNVLDDVGTESGAGRVLYRGHHAAWQWVPADPGRSFPVPPMLSDADALICTQAIPGAFALARAGCQKGGATAVIGLGIVGHLLVRLLALQEPDAICGIDPHPLRRSSLDDIGSVATAASDKNLAGNRFDCVFVACPDPVALTQALRAVAQGGTVVQLAAPYEPVLIDVANSIFRKNTRLLGAHEVGVDLGLTVHANKSELLSGLFDHVVSRRLDLSRVMTRTFVPGTPADAYAALSMNKDALHTAFFDWR